MDKEKIMQEVILIINGQTVKVKVSRVFCGRNPMTEQCSVNIMEDDSGKQVRLFCEDRKNYEEANTLVQKIHEGKITDLTDYLAEWL